MSSELCFVKATKGTETAEPQESPSRNIQKISQLDIYEGQISRFQ